MATIGQLIIAVKTSGVADAKKQLMELDRLSKSISEANIKASTSAKDTAGASGKSGKDELSALKEMYEARSKMATEFYSNDMKAHASALRFMVEQERAAWDKIGKIRAGVHPSGGGGAGITPVDSAGGGPGGGPGGISGNAINSGNNASLITGLVAARAASAIFSMVESISKEAVPNSFMAYERAAESIPFLGQAIGAGTALGRRLSGVTEEEKQSENAIILAKANAQSSSFTESTFENKKKIALIEKEEALSKLKFAHADQLINDENYAKQKTAQNILYEEKIKNAKFERIIQLQNADDVIKSEQRGIDVIEARLKSGPVAGALASVKKQGEDQLDSLEKERVRAMVQGDNGMVGRIENEIGKIKERIELSKEEIKIEEQRAVNFTREKSAAVSGLAKATTANASEEEMNAAKFTEQRALAYAEIARIQALPASKTQQADLEAAYAAARLLESTEGRRLGIVEKMANLRLQASQSAVQELKLSLNHQTLAAENLRDEEATAQRIAAIKLRGGPKVQEEMQAERDMMEGRKAIRQRDLNEAKDFMNAQTDIQERVNSGGITQLEGHLQAIREKTRQAVIRNPEMKAELERQGSAEETTAIRESMSLKAVGTVAARLTAFQGAPRVAGKLASSKDETIMSDEQHGGVYQLGKPAAGDAGKVLEKTNTILSDIFSFLRGGSIISRAQ